MKKLTLVLVLTALITCSALAELSPVAGRWEVDYTATAAYNRCTREDITMGAADMTMSYEFTTDGYLFCTTTVRGRMIDQAPARYTDMGDGTLSVSQDGFTFSLPYRIEGNTLYLDYGDSMGSITYVFYRK